MQVDDRTIKAAFEQHFVRYVKEREWDIGSRIELWEMANNAFGQGSHDHFQEFYDKLRRSWQVFRGSRSHWTEGEAFDALARHDPQLAELRLSCVTKDDWPEIWEKIWSVREIKTTKSGQPSVVAVSKFLHFWNPRLFMIVDDAVVWKWVFAHQWLREDLQRTRKETDGLLPDEERTHDDWACDLPTYLSVEVWAARLMRDNPSILREFVEYLERCRTVPISREVAEYEAAAVEWFLLGLVALPPAGVTI